MSESELTRRLCHDLADLGAICYVAAGGRYSRPGWPDRWIGHRLWSGWVEFKSHSGVPSALQFAIRKELERAIGIGSAVIAWHPSKEFVGQIKTSNTTKEWDGTASDFLQVCMSLRNDFGN